MPYVDYQYICHRAQADRVQLSYAWNNRRSVAYNNALIEGDVDGKRVYLPRYGDEAARPAWEKLGFTARPIDGLTIRRCTATSLRGVSLSR